MGITAYIDRLSDELDCEGARQVAIQELSSLDDRQLEDIGLYRGAIVPEVDAELGGCAASTNPPNRTN